MAGVLFDAVVIASFHGVCLLLACRRALKRGTQRGREKQDGHSWFKEILVMSGLVYVAIKEVGKNYAWIDDALVNVEEEKGEYWYAEMYILLMMGKIVKGW